MPLTPMVCFSIEDNQVPAVQVEITRFTDSTNPGWVECRIADAWGKEWSFVEKLPVVSRDDLGAESEYPQTGIVACEIVKRWQDDQNRDLATIDTTKPWGVESSDGNTQFDILVDQLVNY